MSSSPASTAGMDRAVPWAGCHTGGDLAALWVVEGVGSYGARLARVVSEMGYKVAEAARIDASSSWHGKI